MDTQLAPYKPQELEVAPTMSEMLADWFDHLGRKVRAGAISQDTADGYKRGMKKFIASIGEHAPDGETILQWIGDLRTQGNTPSTVNAWLAGVRSFFEWATTTNHIPFNPTQAIKGVT